MLKQFGLVHKAVWFGAGHNNPQKLCQEIDLDWSTEFTLLGINFDSNLEKMGGNFAAKMRDIKKLLGAWFHRHLTPYGKITVVKSLALSKLSNVALVIPTLSKNMLKEIEGVFYKFIWNAKSEKVRRKDAELPAKYGGLSMVCVKDFWTGFKFSWFRRMLTTRAVWPTILEYIVSN